MFSHTNTNKIGNREVLSQKKSSYSFPKYLRILKKNDFRVLFSVSCVRTKSFLIFYGKNTHSFPRIGLSIHHSCGSAVQRNRIKRILREFFRYSAQDLPFLDIHFLVKRKRRQVHWSLYKQEILRDCNYALKKIRKAK